MCIICVIIMGLFYYLGMRSSCTHSSEKPPAGCFREEKTRELRGNLHRHEKKTKKPGYFAVLPSLLHNLPAACVLENVT